MDSQSNSRPSIDVTSLGSYVFCKRAGVIAYKQQGLKPSNAEEPRIPNLSYLPDFTIEELDSRFKAERPAIAWCGAISFVGLFVVFLLAQFGSVSLSVFILIAILPISWKAMNGGLRLVFIVAELERYKNARPVLLNPLATKAYELMWYDLVKANYIAIKPKERLGDSELNLIGHPWRLLQTTDAVRIPVLNYNGDNFKVRDSHIIRLSLYSHLCKVFLPGSKSDWGILLDVKSKRCFAIPIDDVMRERARMELGEFSHVLQADIERNMKTPIPVMPPCQNCRFARPRLYIRGKSETVHFTGRIGAFPTDDSTKPSVHCDCGDEFGWHPSRQ